MPALNKMEIEDLMSRKKINDFNMSPGKKTNVDKTYWKRTNALHACDLFLDLENYLTRTKPEQINIVL